MLCIALHCNALHCIVLQSGGTDLAWIMRDSARAVPPGLGESRPGLDVVEGLEVSTLRCDEQEDGTHPALRCPCRTLRQRANGPPPGVHSQMRRTRGCHHSALRCPCRPLHQRANGPPPGVPSHMRRARGWHRHRPDLRCPCRPLRQRANGPPRGVHSEMR